MEYPRQDKRCIRVGPTQSQYPIHSAATNEFKQLFSLSVQPPTVADIYLEPYFPVDHEHSESLASHHPDFFLFSEQRKASIGFTP
jgi:hypothetical protein